MEIVDSFLWLFWSYHLLKKFGFCCIISERFYYHFFKNWVMDKQSLKIWEMKEDILIIHLKIIHICIRTYCTCISISIYADK